MVHINFSGLFHRLFHRLNPRGRMVRIFILINSPFPAILRLRSLRTNRGLGTFQAKTARSSIVSRHVSRGCCWFLSDRRTGFSKMERDFTYLHHFRCLLAQCLLQCCCCCGCGVVVVVAVAVAVVIICCYSWTIQHYHLFDGWSLDSYPSRLSGLVSHNGNRTKHWVISWFASRQWES